MGSLVIGQSYARPMIHILFLCIVTALKTSYLKFTYEDVKVTLFMVVLSDKNIVVAARFHPIPLR